LVKKTKLISVHLTPLQFLLLTDRKAGKNQTDKHGKPDKGVLILFAEIVSKIVQDSLKAFIFLLLKCAL